MEWTKMADQCHADTGSQCAFGYALGSRPTGRSVGLVAAQSVRCPLGWARLAHRVPSLGIGTADTRTGCSGRTHVLVVGWHALATHRSAS